MAKTQLAIKAWDLGAFAGEFPDDPQTKPNPYAVTAHLSATEQHLCEQWRAGFQCGEHQRKKIAKHRETLSTPS